MESTTCEARANVMSVLADEYFRQMAPALVARLEIELGIRPEVKVELQPKVELSPHYHTRNVRLTSNDLEQTFGKLDPLIHRYGSTDHVFIDRIQGLLTRRTCAQVRKRFPTNEGH